MQDKTLIHLREWLAQGDCARVAENCEKLAAKTPYRDNPDFFLIKADALRRLGRHQEAALAYRHGAGLSNSARAWLFAGSEHLKGKQNPQALDALRRALYLEPGLEQAHVLLCELLQTLAREREAFPSASRLREYGTSVRALCAAGYVFRSAMRYDESADCFRKALALKPDDWTVQGVALQTAQFALDWDAVEQYTRRLREDLYAQDPIPCIGEQHLTHVSWCMDEAVNERYAHAFLEKEFLKVPRNCYDLGKHRWGKRLKVGYVSADLRNHATLHLLCGVFCAHDRERFEIFAYDHSKDDKSWLRKRYLAAIEHHVDTTAMTDEEVADRVYADGIDVLVDLMGFTDKNRFGVFARRPAPVQVTYLGFPGATGADFIDYVISDPVVTPDSSKPFYTEKFCRLPDTYQCNDNARLTASNDLRRSDYGLPEEAFVFCCFNQSYKIDRETFETWMDVLRGVPGSVLWLLDAGEEARDTLRRQAELRGIAPERLAFAARELHPVHIRRSRLADLALDTRVYNGHTVTSDALWAGVPVVTAKGTHFASRVSASLLHAVGLDECVTGSMKEMGELAVALAHDADRLKALRERLGRNRLLFPLFDTERFTRHLERGYAMMAKRSLAGLPRTIWTFRPFRRARSRSCPAFPCRTSILSAYKPLFRRSRPFPPCKPRLTSAPCAVRTPSRQPEKRRSRPNAPWTGSPQRWSGNSAGTADISTARTSGRRRGVPGAVPTVRSLPKIPCGEALGMRLSAYCWAHAVFPTCRKRGRRAGWKSGPKPAKATQPLSNAGSPRSPFPMKTPP